MRTDVESATGTTLFVLLRDPEDPQAWRGFVQRYAPKILAWCRQRNVQEADAADVAQEVLRRFVQNIRRFSYDPSKRFRAWLKTLMQHAWFDLCAQRRRDGWALGEPSNVALLEDHAAAGSLEDAMDAEFEREMYQEAKARVQLRVTPTTWRAFELRLIEGRSGAQAAKELGIKVSAVHMAVHRVKKSLWMEVDRLEKSGFGEKKSP